MPEGTPPDWALVDIAVPRPAERLPGIAMAGFGGHPPDAVDIAMVAHPSVTILLDLSEGDGFVTDADGRRLRGSIVAGLLPGDLRCGGRVTACLQIRLSPVTAGAILGPGADLAGTVAEFADVWGRDAGRVHDRLRTAPSWNERFAIAAHELTRRLGTRAEADAEVAHAWRRMLAGRGRVRVDDLAEEVGWSRRRLWARFRGALGVTPKHGARLIRFDHAAHLLAAGRAPADTAAEAGYADQSHLHRDVRAMTGLTPGGVAAAPWLSIDDVAWPTPTGEPPSRTAQSSRFGRAAQECKTRGCG